MEVIQAVVDYLLNEVGSSVFMPAVMVIIGLCLKMKLKDAFSSGLMLGVALIGIGMCTSYLSKTISPAITAFVDSTGMQLNIVDVGWSAAAGITWAWPYIFFMFPLQIIINIIMLATKQTDCLNVDLWNVWGKGFTALLVTYVCGNPYIGLACGCIQVVYELKNADVTYQKVKKLCGVPGLSCPHPMGLQAILMYPVDLLLRKIPIMRKEINVDTLREKFGILFEPHVLGFFMGTAIGLLGRMSVGNSLQIGVKLGATFYLLPMVAKLFMTALSPISDAASEIMKSRFPGREFSIGLDWPFMAGRNEFWVTGILLVPVVLFWAAILPWNNVMPLAGVRGATIVYSTMVLTGGCILRMWTLGSIFLPITLCVATYVAPAITQMAAQWSTYDLAEGQMISLVGIDWPEFRWLMMQVGEIFNGNLLGILFLIGYAILSYFYFKGMKKESQALITAENAE